MPYIAHGKDKALVDKLVAVYFLETPVIKMGVLNYFVTKLMLGIIKRFGESYDTYNALVGVLECAKQELIRRRLSPYEDKKCKENGDVYE